MRSANKRSVIEKYTLQDDGKRAERGKDKGYASRVETKKTLDSQGASVVSDTHYISSYILLRIPLEITSIAWEEKVFSIAASALVSALPIPHIGMVRLRECRHLRHR